MNTPIIKSHTGYCSKIIRFAPRIFSVLMLALLLTACAEKVSVEQPGPKVVQGLSTEVIFSPKPLSICDREAGFCADDWGISMELTRMMLGIEADTSFLEKKKAAGMENYDHTRFTFSSGVYCSVADQNCTETEGGDKPAMNYNAILFPDAGEAAE